MSDDRAVQAPAGPSDDATLCVLLTPRACGGHETALLDWLAEVVQAHGLRPWLVASTPALRALCQAQGLGRWLAPLANRSPWAVVAAALRTWPRQRPLLLAPGVLHVQAWLLALLLARRQKLWLYVPMTHTARRMGYRLGPLRDRLLRPWLAGVHGWVVLDASQAEQLRGDWRCRDAAITVLPNLGAVQGPAPRWPAPDADGRLRIAIVGRFDAWQKGLDWLGTLLRERPAWAERLHWHVQGRGPDAPRLQALAAALGPHRLTLHEHAPLAQALAACDLLLLPSRYEGQPLVALEAIRCGWPVLASHQAGLDTLLPPQALFHFGDADGLARALAAHAEADVRHASVAHSQARLAAAGLAQRRTQALRALAAQWRAPAVAARHPPAAASTGPDPC